MESELMRNNWKYIALISIILTANHLQAKSINASEFGINGDGKTDNTEAFKKAFEYAKEHPGTTLDIPRGIYRLATPTAKLGKEQYIFRLEDLSKTTINGHNSEFIIGAPAGAFYLENCKSLTFKNISFDYDPPPITQGSILQVLPSENAIIVDVDPGYPRHDDPNSFAKEEDRIQSWMTLYQQDGTPLLGSRVLRFFKYEALGNGTFKLYHDMPQLEKIPGVQSGIRYVRVFRRWGHLIRAYACDNLTYDNLSFYSASGFVSLISYCNHTTIKNCRIIPRPNSTRMVSSAADGFHFIGGRQAILEKNYFSRLQDDNIVLAVRGNLISKVDGNKLTLSPASETLYRNDDRIEVLNIDMGLREEFKIQEVEESGTYPSYHYTILLDRPLDDEFFSNQTHPLMAFNRSQALQGSRIIQNTMSHCRARGILLHAIDIQIEKNSISHFTGAGIAGGLLVQFPRNTSVGAKGFWAYYLAENIQIKNNTFDSCLNYGGHFGYKGAISFESVIQNDSSSIRAPANDLLIKKNTIKNCGGGGIAVEDAKRVRILNNSISVTNDLNGILPHGIYLENVDKWELKNNVIKGNVAEEITIISAQ